MPTPLTSADPPSVDPADFAVLVEALRPELHRYCARMIGSVVDAEDVVQEALAKAYTALPGTSVANMRGWLFRIAHNKAVDHLRRARHEQVDYLDDAALLVAPDAQFDAQDMVAVALTVFLKLAPKQRSCVILKDVLGYSLADISELLDATIPEIKAALHRGRGRLRELSRSLDAAAGPPADAQEQRLLARYIDRFNAQDFDAVRAMLAAEVRLDLVNRLKLRGHAAVGEYFHRYAQAADWYLALGTVDQRAAILVYADHERLAPPAYFILLTWEAGQVALIRDYRYTPYITRDALLAETGCG